MPDQKPLSDSAYFDRIKKRFRGDLKFNLKGMLQEIVGRLEVTTPLSPKISEEFQNLGRIMDEFETTFTDMCLDDARHLVMIQTVYKSRAELRLELARRDNDLEAIEKEEQSLSKYDEFFTEVLMADSAYPEIGLLKTAHS